MAFVLVAVGMHMLGRSSAPAPTPASPRNQLVTAGKPAIPAPAKPEEDLAAKEALSALMTLELVTTVGATDADYLRCLADARIRLDRVSAKIKDPRARALAERAMLYYEGVAHVWESRIRWPETSRQDLAKFLRAFSDCQLVSTLLDKASGEDQPNVRLTLEGPSVMMICASQKITEMQRLVDGQRG